MFQIMFEHDESCSACLACSEHVWRSWTCFEHDTRNFMFKLCSRAVIYVQIMFGHVQHVQSLFKSSWTWKSWTWFSCSRTCFSCSWTWLNTLKHDCHVQNKTVMFCTWHVMFWTRMSCSKHDSYVLNMTIMFLTWLSCSVMFQHVPKQYSSAKPKCSITGFEHKWICIGVNCTNHSTQGLFCKFGREKGLYQNRNLRWFQIENLKWCHTTPSCFTLSQNTISRVLMWVLYYKLNSC